MTTTAIKRLTLTERAIAAWEAEEDRLEAAGQEQESALRESLKQLLLGKMSDALGIEFDPDAVVFVPNTVEDEEARPFFARATVDGITFSTDSHDAWLRLVLPCGEGGCQAEVLRYVSDLADVGRSRVTFQQCDGCHQRSLAEDGRIPIVEATPDDYIAEVELAGGALAEATARVQELADGRAAEKSAAIIRLMQTHNPETSTETNPKFHSASSAEKIVEKDESYLRYRVLEREAEVERIRADAHYRAVQLQARLAVGLAVRGDP